MAKSKAKKKIAKAKGGIQAYIRKIESAPKVKSASKKVKELEAKLKKAQSHKNKAKKEAQKKYRKLHKC